MTRPLNYWHGLKRILLRMQPSGLADSSNVAIEQAIEIFRVAPEKYIVHPQTHTPCWDAGGPGFGGINSLESADVLVGVHVLAHIRNVQISDGIATVGHFAVADKKLEGFGVGRVLAYCMAQMLISHQGVRSIIFEENSTRFEEAGYARFFTSLGARQLERRPFWDRADTPRFEWDIRELADLGYGMSSSESCRGLSQR